MPKAKKPVLKKNCRGSTVVDYLLIIALVSAIAVPLVVKYLGEPLMKGMQGQRGKLVQFIAQSPKRPVPNAWFSRERPPQVESTDINNPEELPDTEVADPKELKNPRQLRTRNIQNPRALKNGQIQDPAQLQVGQIPAGVSTASSGAGGAGGAGGGGGSMDSDFFSGGESKGGGSDSSSQSGSSGGRTYGRSSGDDGGDDDVDFGPSGETKKEKEKPSNDSTEQKGGIGEGKKSQNILMQKAEEAERARKTEFDWWMLLRILVVLAILFILVLIALSSARKN